MMISGLSTAETPVVNTEQLAERAQRISRTIEALEALKNSAHWQTIVRDVFDPELALLRGRMVREKDTTELFRLQGKIEWAEKKVDMPKLLTQYRSELAGIMNQLHGK